MDKNAKAWQEVLEEFDDETAFWARFRLPSVQQARHFAPWETDAVSHVKDTALRVASANKVYPCRRLSNIKVMDMDQITKQQTQREMDIALAGEARGIVFRSLIKSIKEHGKESPETKKIEEQMDKYTSILSGVQAGDADAIKVTRTELKKFVETNSPRKDLTAVNGSHKPDEFRPR